MSTKLKIIRKKRIFSDKKKLIEPTKIESPPDFKLNVNNIREYKKFKHVPVITLSKSNQGIVINNIRRNADRYLEVHANYRQGNVQIKNPTVEISIDNLDNLPLEESFMGKKYNWRKGPINELQSFHNFALQSRRVKIPPIIDLRGNMPTIYDQENLGSCTANSVCAAYIYSAKKNKKQIFNPSRLFVYYNSRLIYGTINEDSGATLEDSCTSIKKYGICEEVHYPYDISKFTLKPSDKAYQDGLNHQVINHRRVNQTLSELKACIANNYPFVFGFLVFRSFESARTSRTGIMSMPGRRDPVLGGHAVVACGYDDRRRVFIVRNSWGTGWGDKGYFYMPYDFITNRRYCGDFWTIEQVE